MWDVRRMLLNQESSKKATAPAVAFIILLNNVLVLHLRCGYSSVS